MREKLKQLDSNEFRSGLMFLWLAGLCLLAASVFATLDIWGWAIFTLIFIAVLAVFSGISFIAQAPGVIPQYCASCGESLGDQEQVGDATAQQEPNLVQFALAAPQTPAEPQVQVMDGKTYNYYQHMAFFLQQVVEVKLTSQPAWQKAHGWPASAYEAYMNELEQAGIVVKRGQGAGREILVANMAEAWQLLSTHDGFDIPAALNENRPINKNGKQLGGVQQQNATPYPSPTEIGSVY